MREIRVYAKTKNWWKGEGRMTADTSPTNLTIESKRKFSGEDAVGNESGRGDQEGGGKGG